MKFKSHREVPRGLKALVCQVPTVRLRAGLDALSARKFNAFVPPLSSGWFVIDQTPPRRRHFVVASIPLK